MAPGNVWLTLADSFLDAVVTAGVGAACILGSGSWALGLASYKLPPIDMLGKVCRALAPSKGLLVEAFEALLSTSEQSSRLSERHNRHRQECPPEGVRRSAETQTFSGNNYPGSFEHLLARILGLPVLQPST
ncbi:uncharacterized protein BP5553_02034 [Venustampulla echinocandica]|uniref:Uncharacterized protein n=1 Tax=Venustampulla echinocandica TaxID=2656787 RepID=A0A370U2S1_9HELO|nr:uncharacterized protein BP5553_02034 [Venustampulla echinocandica]RDL42055.1 hypothetical protein BP5553_02034 [Venustampulla echinocandica]